MSFSLIIRGQKFFFDVDNLPDLCTNKSKSTAIIRWKLDDNNMPYHLDNNAKVIYLIDKIMKNKCPLAHAMKRDSKYYYARLCLS